ncbi:MAG: CsgG/HfaB family protein [bacterium]|nr:CsgG/HfaB family protein [bacterium]
MNKSRAQSFLRPRTGSLDENPGGAKLKVNSIGKILLFVLLLVFSGTGVFAEEGKTFLAVLDLEIVGNVPQDLKIPLSDSLREGLFRTGRFRVIDRNNMDRILKEQGQQLSDCSSSECAVQVGRLLGVQKMVTASLSRVGNIFVVSAQLINVETGEIEMIASDRCPCQTDELLPSVDRVSGRLAGNPAAEKTAPPEKMAPSEPVSPAPAQENQAAEEEPAYQNPKSLWVAGVLSIIPGLGQVYNEQYVKGIIFFGACATFGALGSAQAKSTGSKGIWGGLGGLTWLANEADALWSAHRINRAAKRKAEEKKKLALYDEKITASLNLSGGGKIE